MDVGQGITLKVLRWSGCGHGHHTLKLFLLMDKALSGELSCMQTGFVCGVKRNNIPRLSANNPLFFYLDCDIISLYSITEKVILIIKLLQQIKIFFCSVDSLYRT